MPTCHWGWAEVGPPHRGRAVGVITCISMGCRGESWHEVARGVWRPLLPAHLAAGPAPRASQVFLVHSSQHLLFSFLVLIFILCPVL